MDDRCPLCGRDLGGKKKLAYSVIARMDLDCPHCKGGLSVNVHRVETAVVVGSAAAVLGLAVLSYVLQSRALLLAALAAGMAAAAMLALVERAWLRDWPRYVARRGREGME